MKNIAAQMVNFARRFCSISQSKYADVLPPEKLTTFIMQPCLPISLSTPEPVSLRLTT